MTQPCHNAVTFPIYGSQSQSYSDSIIGLTYNGTVCHFKKRHEHVTKAQNRSMARCLTRHVLVMSDTQCARPLCAFTWLQP